MLYSFSTGNRSIKRKTTIAHMLPATGNRSGFAVQTVANAFTVFVRAAEVGSGAQGMGPYLLSDHELRELEGLKYCAWGYAPLEQHTSLDADKRIRYDGTILESAALCLSPADNGAFRFLNYIFLSHLGNLISSARLNGAILDG